MKQSLAGLPHGDVSGRRRGKDAFGAAFAAAIRAHLPAIAQDIKKQLSVTVSPVITPRMVGVDQSLRGIHSDTGIGLAR